MGLNPEYNSEKLKPWIVLNEHDEINNQWLRIRNVTFLLPNGRELSDYYIAEKPPVSVVVPIKEGKTYLIREFERGVSEVGHKFPAGRVDEQETPLEAAQREFKEELGLQSGNLIYLGESYVDPGFMTTRAHFFLAFEPKEVEEEKEKSPFELFEGEWVDFSQISEMIAQNQIKNPFVIVGYVLAQNYLQQNPIEPNF